jgi:phosphatidylethanolamine-binding protein (PEBP) family uncharacterized protein
MRRSLLFFFLCLGQAQAGGFTLSSPAFGKSYPVEFTCDGESASPPLAWKDAPAGTRSFAITMHHIPPGAEDRHVYMVVYNIPAGVSSLAKNSREVGAWGVNTVNRQPQYTPPCSKGPGEKTYTLTVYALSSEPNLTFSSGPVTLDMLLAAIKDKTLATSAMDVVYARQGNGGPPPQRIEQTIQSLHLEGEQQQKVRAILQQYSEKQRQLRDELLQQLRSVLDAGQFAKIEAAGRP